jgi:NDP-sugar pyrophosphorylase family protein
MAEEKIKAMILAAGLGTRLKPFTDKSPKALFKVDGVTLLERSILHLKQTGIKNIIINVHHFPGQIIGFLKEKGNFGLDISISDETGKLLDTGGGVKKASWFFQDSRSILVINVDVVSDLDLQELIRYHFNQNALATLVVRKRETRRYFLFDQELILNGWENIKTGERVITRNNHGILQRYAFSGIQVISPEIFKYMTGEERFSLTEMYLHLSATHNITAFIDEKSIWFDAGKMNH